MTGLTSNINYLQPTGFKLVIDRKKFGNLEFFAQSVDHPSLSIPTADVPYKRVNVHLAGDKLTFGELTATIIIDENLSSYTEIYDWAKRLVEQNNKVRGQEDNGFPTMVDITVVVLNSKNNVTKNIRYLNCVPTDIGPINFQSTTETIQYLTFNATFKVGSFELI